MKVEEFLDKKPSKKEVAEMLCRMSNHVLFGPPWNLFCWKELVEYADLTEDDFWEDADALSPMDYLYGQCAWKFKENEGEFTDNDKFDILAQQAKELNEKMLDNQ